MKSTSTSQANGRQGAVEAQAVRWEDLPHSRVHTAIRLEVLTRKPEEALHEAELQRLKDDLPKWDSEDHRKYVTLTIVEMKRELRIWRDCYWDYLDSLNRASHTEKRRVIDLAVAPVAAGLLARQASKYIIDSDVDPAVFNLIFRNPFPLVLVSLDDSIESGPLPPPPEMSIETIMRKVFPKSSFSNVRKRGGFLSGGPFALPALPRPTGATLYASQPVWLPSLCRMWDAVLREIVIQHISIDLEERLYRLRADERLTQFQKVAGTLYLRYAESYGRTLPEHVWKQLAETLDEKSIPLRDNLEQRGKAVLDAAFSNITTWLEAITYEKPADQSAPKEFRDGRVRYTGDLTRHAKRAIHRAKDALLKIRAY